jgi:hypothetical protein
MRSASACARHLREMHWRRGELRGKEWLGVGAARETHETRETRGVAGASGRRLAAAPSSFLSVPLA